MQTILGNQLKGCEMVRRLLVITDSGRHSRVQIIDMSSSTMVQQKMRCFVEERKPKVVISQITSGECY